MGRRTKTEIELLDKAFKRWFTERLKQSDEPLNKTALLTEWIHMHVTKRLPSYFKGSKAREYPSEDFQNLFRKYNGLLFNWVPRKQIVLTETIVEEMFEGE